MKYPALLLLIGWLMLPSCVLDNAPTSLDQPLGEAVVLNAELHRRVVSNVDRLPDGRSVYAWVSNVPGPSEEQPWYSYGRLEVLVEGQKPYLVRDPDGEPVVDPESPPQLTHGPDGEIYVAYTGSSTPESVWQATGMRLLRSLDGGATWEAPVSVGGGFGEYRNNHELHVTKDGILYLAWLDAGVAPEGQSTIHVVVSRSDDRGRTWTDPVVVDAQPSCECCRVAVTSDAKGGIYVAWRKIMTGGIRDIVVARSTDAGRSWSSPQRVHADDWVQGYCPDAGPSMAADTAGRLHVAWWTGKEGEAGVRYVQSHDRGQTFGAPLELKVATLSRASHVQLAAPTPDDIVVVWDDGTLQAPRIAMRRSFDGGASFEPLVYLSPSGQASAYPHVATGEAGWEVVWNRHGSSETPSRTVEAEAAQWTPPAGDNAPQIFARRSTASP